MNPKPLLQKMDSNIARVDALIKQARQLRDEWPKHREEAFREEQNRQRYELRLKPIAATASTGDQAGS